MRRSLGFACLMSALAAAALAQSADGMFASGAIAARLDGVHAAAAAADEEKYFSYFTPDAVFLGTDASERWTRDEFRKWAHPYFAKGKAWTYKSMARWITFCARPQVAWFDELLDTPQHGAVPRLRGARRASAAAGRSRSTTSSHPDSQRPRRRRSRSRSRRTRRRRKGADETRGFSSGSVCALASLGAAPARPPPRTSSSATAPSTRSTARGSWAEAVARLGRSDRLRRDRRAAAKAWIGPTTKVVDLGGKMLLPAFHDSHVHPISGGIEALECDLHGLATSGRGPRKPSRDYAAAHPDGEVDPGRRLGAAALSRRGNPTKALLDTVVPDRPVLLDASDGHSAWANSKALAIAGITKDTPDPPHGRIERDPRTGEPSGRPARGRRRPRVRLLPRRTAPADYAAGLQQALADRQRVRPDRRSRRRARRRRSSRPTRPPTRPAR